MSRDQRRLAAIFSADVAGYSRLRGRDDGGTLAALKAHPRELFGPAKWAPQCSPGGRLRGASRTVRTTGAATGHATRCSLDQAA